MFNGLIYFAYYASSAFFIWSIPSEFTKSCLTIFSISSFITSVFIVYILSNDNAVENLKKIILSTSIFLVSSLFFLDSQQFIWITYPIVMIVADYLSSQCGIVNASKYFRLILSALVLPIIFYNDYVVEILLLRIFACSVGILFFLVFAKKFHKLSLGRAIHVIAVTNISYYGSLYLLSATLPAAILKQWYIFTQIGLTLNLKGIDYYIRHDSNRSRLIDIGIPIITLLILIVLGTKYPNVIGLGIFVLSWFLLFRLKCSIENGKSI